MIKPLSLASIIAGSDGLIIEAHTNPDKSLSDSKQTVDIKTIKEIIEDIDKLNDIDIL